MTGCASNPYQTYDNTKTGAFIGATIGALAKSDGNRDDIAKGIAAGAGYVADRFGY